MSIAFDIKAATPPALVKRGGVNVISLEAIRANVGARWDKLQESIYARLEGHLSHKLGSTDFYIRLSETSYLVVTPGCDAEEAQLCCLKIAYDLHRGLFGDCAVADLAVSRMDCDQNDGRELHPLTMQQLRDLALRGGIEQLCGDLPRNAAPLVIAQGNAARPVFRFAPVWDVQHEAITAYKLEIDGGVVASPGVERQAVRAALATLLEGLSHATRLLSTGLGAGIRHAMVVPVPFDILSAPHGRMEIGAACRALPAGLRPLLVFQIAAIPPGVPQSRMGDLVCSVRPFCRAVTLELPVGSFDHYAYRNAGHQGAGVSLDGLNGATTSEMEKLAAAARLHRFTSFANGVSSLELAQSAKAFGLHYLSGSFVGIAVDVPQPMRRLGWELLASRPVPAATGQTT